MNRDPRSAGGGIDEGIEQRPVGNRVTAIDHCFSFPERRRDRTGVEVVATNHNWCTDLTAPDEFVHRHTKLGTSALAEPADACRQALKLNPLLGELHPTRQRSVPREELKGQTIGPRDVGGIATQRNPTERALPFAKAPS